MIDLNNEVLNLEEKLYSLTKERQENYEKVIAGIGTEFSKYFNLMNSERIARESLHSQYSDLIEEVKMSVKLEIDKESREREAAEEKLIRLLEDTCQRIEIGLGREYNNHS